MSQQDTILSADVTGLGDSVQKVRQTFKKAFKRNQMTDEQK